MKPWLQNFMELGLVPYVASNNRLAGELDYSLFEGEHIVKILEDEGHLPFHHAYLLSNSLGFGNSELKMPNWVYIDCVLMQTAVVGFAMAVDKVPQKLLEYYQNDPLIDLDKLDYIPISGQIASLGMDGNTITGYSLFSLKTRVPSLAKVSLGAATKYAALSVYKADREGKKVMGIAQYNNPALKIHASFGTKLYIEQPIIPLHPLKDMTFTYSMDVSFDDERIFHPLKDDGGAPDFLMHYDDVETKRRMQKEIAAGKRFFIKDPIHIKKDGEIYLPICTET